MNKVLLEIDIISDVVCPWCVIGFGRLQIALEQLKYKVGANITWHPFELNPAMPQSGENLRDHLAAKYGTTLEGSIKARTTLKEFGKEIGFDFNYFDDMKMLNSHQCHQLLLWAKGSGKQSELAMALFELFFSKRGEFNQSILLALVENVGLDVQQAREVLDSNSSSEQVKVLERQWQQQGIQVVPAFIFNQQEIVTGAQDVESLVSLMNRLITGKVE